MKKAIIGMAIGVAIMVFVIGFLYGRHTKYCAECPPVYTIKDCAASVDSAMKKSFGQSFIDSIRATVKPLFIQYYKAGWMDASNGMIDLSNAGSLDDASVKKIQYKHWRKIEFEVNSK